jgi:hypothetical protein
MPLSFTDARRIARSMIGRDVTGRPGSECQDTLAIIRDKLGRWFKQQFDNDPRPLVELIRDLAKKHKDPRAWLVARPELEPVRFILNFVAQSQPEALAKAIGVEKRQVIAWMTPGNPDAIEPLEDRLGGQLWWHLHDALESIENAYALAGVSAAIRLDGSVLHVGEHSVTLKEHQLQLMKLLVETIGSPVTHENLVENGVKKPNDRLYHLKKKLKKAGIILRFVNSDGAITLLE